MIIRQLPADINIFKLHAIETRMHTTPAFNLRDAEEEGLREPHCFSPTFSPSNRDEFYRKQ